MPERMSLCIVVVSFQIPVSAAQRHLLQGSCGRVPGLQSDGAVHGDTGDHQDTAEEAEPWPGGSGSTSQGCS